MKKLSRKHFLKKRINALMLSCTFITIILFGAMIIFIAQIMFKSEAEFITSYFSRSIAQNMNSSYFMKQMGIQGLEELDSESPEVKEWLNNIENMEKNNFVINYKQFTDSSGNFTKIKKSILQNYSLANMVHVNITLNGKTIYSKRTWQKNKLFTYIFGFEDIPEMRGKIKLLQKLFDYYNSECSYHLFNSTNDNIGEVTAKINDDILLLISLALVIIIFLTSLISLIIAYFVSKFLTLPIIVPIKQLEQKIKSIASGDYESTIHAHITLKKPLMEIQSLASSTNTIIEKMKNYNELLTAQYEELEAQNEELVLSKKQIQEAQTLLVQNENMASIGQLTAAITHEINTPLGAICSNAQICDMFINLLMQSETIQSNDDLLNEVSQMQEANNISIMACRRVTDIIKSLKNFTRIDQAEYQETDINECIKSVLILTSNLWKRKISIHEDYGKLPIVKCFPGLLNQVFMNIIVNAIQAIEDKGDIYIKTHADDKHVYTHIRDTGSGISAKDLPKIFDSGFTTKGNGIGMGLGLSICRNIIIKHNGEIEVNSEPGKGSEFLVTIPIIL